MPVVSTGVGALSLLFGVMTLMRARALSQRAYYQDGQCLVSVRYPGQWYELTDFVQPDNADVLAAFSEIRPDVWSCLDWVCRNISYRRDIGEWWSFPTETLNRGSGDCEDSSILTCSLLRNFTNAYVALGSFEGFGHAWVAKGGEILETTYTSARPVADPKHYVAFILFNDRQVIELWPGALGEVFQLGRDEVAKLNLMAEELKCISL